MSLLKSVSHWPISRKLFSGFAVLVLLSVVVGGIGWLALERYSHRSLIVADVGSVESSLLKARTEEKNFLLRYDETYLGRVMASTASAHARLDALKQLINVPEDFAAVTSMQAGIRSYEKYLNKLAQNITQRSERLKALELGSRRVESRLTTEQALFEAAGSLKRMRREERSFLLENNPDAVTRFRKLATAALASVESSYVNQAVKDEISQLFRDYSAAFEESVGATQEMRELEQEMVAVARSNVAKADALQALQLEKMIAEKRQAIWLILGVVALVLIIGALLGWRLTRSITHPIREAVQLASQVASGDLSGNIRSDRGDEFGQLLSALGTMVTNLRELVKNIDGNSGRIAASAEQLSSITERTSAGVAQQRDQTDQVATAMNEMVSTASAVATNAGEAFTAANLARDKAASGETAVENTLAHVNDLNAKVVEVMARLEGLQADTKNIGTVLDVIKSVAEQTNLLALNAAIEAARAGEHGRGFAVVADEVRSLAQRTQSSTVEIETLIKSLVGSAENSLESMTIGSELAQNTLDKARAAGEQIREITQAVEDINRVNSQIATAAEQQTAVAEDINQNVTLIRDGSDQSSADANDVASASLELARLGNELRGQVARFRL